MTGSTRRITRAVPAPPRRIGWKLAALLAVLAAIGAASAAAGVIVPQKAERLAATFDARAVSQPTIGVCRGLGVDGQKVQGRYGGTMTLDGEEYALNFTLEALVDSSAGVGTATGSWRLAQPPDPGVVARGELVATVTGDPPSELEPPDPDLELHGVLIGALEPPDPDQPAQKLLANFSASLGEGALNFTGAAGDPAGLTANPAVLLPAIKC